jgi:hypothetical protein
MNPPPLGRIRPQHVRDCLEVAAAADAPHDADPLRGDAELVAHRDADPRLTDVEGRDPHGRALNIGPGGPQRRVGD